MKNSRHINSGIISLVTITTLCIAQPFVSSVYAEDVKPETLTSQNLSFSFTATVLDKNGKVLAGKAVKLTDITDSSAKDLQVLITDKTGQAVFSQLPTNRNISVSVDGKVQGYTLRTSQSGSTMAASFTAEGTGTENPTYGVKPLDIYVRNQEGIGISGKTVSLKDKNGNLISSLKSDENGLVHFTDRLMEGTYYSYFIGEQEYGETMPGVSRSIYLDDSKVEESFTFTANILGKNENTVAGKSVELYDITEGNSIKVSKLVSDANGQAVFDGLALNRNYSIYVDGKNQGYTIRTSQAGTKKAAAFYVEENGNQKPIYSTIPISVTIRNEDGEGISNQGVTISNKQGKVIEELLSDKDGKVTFTKNLMEGTFYSVKVNGIAMKELVPGNDVSIYLTNEQIQKKENEKGSDYLEKRHEDKAEKDSIVKTGTKNEAVKKVRLFEKLNEKVEVSGNSENVSSVVQTSSSNKNDNNLHLTKQLKSVLPQTGSEKRVILTLVGLISVTIASLILLANKYNSFRK